MAQNDRKQGDKMKKSFRKYMYFFFILILFCSGCVAKKADSSVKIGLLMPLSGAIAEYGEEPKKGAEIYINQYNEDPERSTQIKLISYNDEGDALKTTSGFNFLLDKDVSAIITGASSTLSLITAPLAHENKIPMILTTASNEDIIYDKTTKTLKDCVFRSCFTDSFQGRNMAKFAHDNFKSELMTPSGNGFRGRFKEPYTAILYCKEDPYSEGLKNAYEDECKRINMPICAIENFSKDATDFSSQLTKIKVQKPLTLFIPTYYQTAALILDQAARSGLECKFIGCDGWVSIGNFVSDKQVLKKCFYCSAYSKDDPSDLAQKFRNLYIRTYKTEPTMFSAVGYDCANILVSAIDKTIKSGIEVKSPQFKTKITENLKSTNSDAVTGHIKFDEFNNPNKEMNFITFIEGSEKLLFKY